MSPEVVCLTFYGETVYEDMDVFMKITFITLINLNLSYKHL